MSYGAYGGGQQVGYGQGQGWQGGQQGGYPNQGGYVQQGYQQQAPPSQHYGNYGQQFQQNVFSINAWQSMGFSAEDEFLGIFNAKMSARYGALQAHQLHEILNETPRIRDYYRISWSLELCKIMLAMLDRSGDGLMQYPEFKELLQCLVFWHQTFCQYDCDRSGFIEAHELGRVCHEKFGYVLSVKVKEVLLKRYSRAMDDGRCLIAFDDFVALCVRLRAYTEAFRARDRLQHGNHEAGNANFSYDDFLQCIMCL